MSRNPPRGSSTVRVVLILLILALIAATALVVWMCVDLVNTSTVQVPTEAPVVTLPVSTRPTEAETEPPETTMPEPEKVIATATIASTGDLLMHKPIISLAAQGDGTYNFDFIFTYLSEYTQSADYALANLETTLAGDSKPYQGNPLFNCPDEIVDACKNAGLDMLLTANNHSFDTGWDGYVRTLEVVQSAGLDTLGTMAEAEDPKYLIKEINGIKIGMLCYTYETSNGGGNTPSLNGIPMTGATYDNINCYNPNNVEPMYQEVEQYLAEMEAAGVEATVLYIHWGPQEYALTANALHVKMSQRLCDLGIDVIVGGHPHVVQPMDLLTSTTDPEHKTVVLYSMGNAVSNQRKGNLSQVTTAHTEDGVLFSITFCKYSDGRVYLDSVELMPTWVNLVSGDGYYILPLDDSTRESWKEKYQLSDSLYQQAVDSYDRTMALVGEGLEECQTWLAQEAQDREAYYLDLAMNPDKYAAEATEVTEATETTQATETAA